MVYWRQERDRKKGTQKLAEAQEQKEMRKNMSSNSQANAYEIQKNARFVPNFAKLKPDLKNKYPQYFQPSLYLFKNPIFEEFFTKYMDDTQHLIGEAI